MAKDYSFLNVTALAASLTSDYDIKLYIQKFYEKY